MDTNKTDGEFTQNIDDAIDSILVPKRDVILDPETGEVLNETGKKETEKKETGKKESRESEEKHEIAAAEGSMMIENAGGEEGTEESTDKLLVDLNEALLSLEWELSEFNLKITEELLQKLEDRVSDQPDSITTIRLMIQVLDNMAQNPDNVPVSATKCINEGLRYLVSSAGVKETNLDGTAKPADKVIAELQELLDQVHITSTSPAVEGGRKSGGPQEEQEPAESKVIKDAVQVHLALLARWINLILNLESFFAKKPSLKKLQTYHQAIRRQLEEEKDILSGVYTRALRTQAEDQSSASAEEQLLQEIHNHMAVLDECVKAIKPVENIFAQNTGWEKAHSAVNKLRLDFEKTRLELGENIPRSILLQPVTRQVNLVRLRSKAAKCPWKELNLGLYQGEYIAFIPDQTVFTGRLSRWSRRGLAGLSSFPLNKLKRWPWNKIKSRLQGELSEKEEAALKGLNLPFVKVQGLPEMPGAASDNPVVAIIFKNNDGGVIFLDQMPQLIQSADYKWKAPPRRDGILAGYLIDNQGKKLSVLSME